MSVLLSFLGNSVSLVRLSTPVLTVTTGFNALNISAPSVLYAQGYEYRIGANSDLTGAGTEISNPGTISGLTGGNRYYVQLRAYSVNNGIKYYSDWSDVVSGVASTYDIPDVPVFTTSDLITETTPGAGSYTEYYKNLIITGESSGTKQVTRIYYRYRSRQKYRTGSAGNTSTGWGNFNNWSSWTPTLYLNGNPRYTYESSNTKTLKYYGGYITDIIDNSNSDTYEQYQVQAYAWNPGGQSSVVSNTSPSTPPI